MYKYSKNLKYPLNLLEDAIGFLGVNNEGYGSVNFGKKEKSIEEVLEDTFGIEANETFFKWLDKYIEKEWAKEKIIFDKRYKEKKSFRQIERETGYSAEVVSRRVRRFGMRFIYTAKDYRNEMGIVKKK